MAYQSKFTGAEVDALLEQVQNGDVGGKVTVDSSLSTESENPVMNKVITEGLNKKLEGEVIGTTSPTEGTVGDSYDDTELREAIAEQGEKLTELSEENERLRERIEEQDQFIEDLQNTKIDRENDDYYPKMAVGLADNLAGVDVVDSEINFRRSGGGAISDGVARIEAIKGNSVVWNQLMQKPSSTTMNGITFTVNANGSIVTNGTATATAYIVNRGGLMTDSAHKYAVLGAPQGGSFNTYYFGNAGALNDYGNGVIANGAGIATSFACRIASGTTVTNLVFRPLLIDLTKMFGSGNEPTTIEEFYARIPMGVNLNAYNEGEVIHMDVQSIESVGVNQWDEEWEQGGIASASGLPITLAGAIRSKNFSPIFPSTSYYVNWAAYTGDKYIFFYDREQNFISKSSFASNGAVNTPSNAAYFKIRIDQGSSFHKDICINRYDTAINGKYFPYIKRVEDLAVIRKYFPNGMKSAGTAHDEIRYNKTTQKREKVVRIGEVDMGTLLYRISTVNNAEETYNVFYTYDLNNIVKLPSYRDFANILTSKLVTAQTQSLFDYVLKDKSIMLYGDGTIYIRNTAHTDVESFKAAMQGVMLYYELAEPIITELDKEDQLKDWDYSVWNAGTEKAIAEGKSAPLAADITYGFNAIGKIKELESLVAALKAKVGI